jgi:hypothetical protein
LDCGPIGEKAEGVFEARLVCAIFLILEMNRPYEGMIQISSTPLRNAPPVSRVKPIGINGVGEGHGNHEPVASRMMQKLRLQALL